MYIHVYTYTYIVKTGQTEIAEKNNGFTVSLLENVKETSNGFTLFLLEHV